MKAIKIIAAMIGWLGLSITLLGTYPGLLNIPRYLNGFHNLPRFHPYPLMQFGLEMMFIVSSFGTILVILGGLIARPRYFWQGSAVVGFISIIAVLTELAYYRYYFEGGVGLQFLDRSPFLA